MSRKKEPPKSPRRAAASPRRPTEKFEQAFEQIYRIVLRIPRGRVMAYGQIARLLDDRYSPRLVGWAMHATPQDGRDIPWHRVINSKGGISTGRVIIAEPQLQRYLLEAEGVVFDERGHCDLSLYQWSPPTRRAKAESLGKLSAKAAKPSKAPAKKRAKQRAKR
jgi:methylated-DNA-protein-cysteine methyltransferase related protein